MNADFVVCLVSETYTSDEYGRQIQSETTKNVFGSRKSISQSEFYHAGQSGLKPQYVVEVSEHDYDGQKIVDVGGERYAVYRTYCKKNEIVELYLTQKAGA